MRLIQVLAIVLAQFGIGTLLMTSLLSAGEIRLGFFTFNSALSALAVALSLVFSKMSLGAQWYDVRFLGFTVIGATIAYGSFRLERPEIGRVFLVLSSLVGLTLGLLPLALKMLAVLNMETSASSVFGASALAGALLLGAANVTMILGHWYLLMRRLSLEYLERFSQILLAVVALRFIVLMGSFELLRSIDPKLARTFLPNLWAAHGNLFFFSMRVLWGLVIPLVLSVFVLRCVKEKASQAATGMLYVISVSVLFGELFAAYLMI